MMLSAVAELLIKEAIEDAIYEGAHAWDCMASPAVDEPTKKALQRIKEILATQHYSAATER